jgi:hypothetical protein
VLLGPEGYAVVTLVIHGRGPKNEIGVAHWGEYMSIEQAIALAGQVAWPLVALIALFVLRPYVSALVGAASDLRSVLDRSGEIVGLMGKLRGVSEGISDLKAMQELSRARQEAPSAGGDAEIGELWGEIEKEWQDTKEAFRAVAQAAAVSVSFHGTVGVRDAGTLLVEKGVIAEQTASGMTDLSAQYQWMYRTTTDRAQYLNANVVASYRRAAGEVRKALRNAL